MNTLTKQQSTPVKEKSKDRSKPVLYQKNKTQFKQALKGLSYQEGVKKLSLKKEETPASPAQPDIIYPAGTNGMITENTKAKSGDKDMDIPKGNVVEVVEDKGKDLVVKAWSGLNGIPVTIKEDVFKEEPGLTTYDHDKDPSTVDVPRPYKYKEFSPSKKEDALTPGGRAPAVSDVSQGAIGDCYLMAGMGAVAAARSDLIEKMISYDEKTKLYTVTFKEIQPDRKTFKDVKITVDAYLPVEYSSPKYAQDFLNDPKDQAIWPAIIEKAYAKWNGSYQKIVGGVSGRAMEAITGAASSYPPVPPEGMVINFFKQLEKDKKIVTVSTVDYIEETSTKDFSGTAPGPFSATLKGSGNKPAHVVKSSLSITDKGKKAGDASDDGKGKITGANVKEGNVTYETGLVNLTYNSKDKSPDKPEDLQAKYRYERLISDSLNIYGNHAYIFVRVDGDNLIFANPWGPDASYQPKPVSSKDFVKYFETIAVNAPAPQEKP